MLKKVHPITNDSKNEIPKPTANTSYRVAPPPVRALTKAEMKFCEIPKLRLEGIKKKKARVLVPVVRLKRFRFEDIYIKATEAIVELRSLTENICTAII